MNRNVESHFSELPSVEIQRSIFDHSHSHKTSFNVGELIPYAVEEVLPGSTFKVTTSCVMRLQTLLNPIMDNMYCDTYHFFVPYRLVWEHWKNFMGEQGDNPWIPEVEYTVPQIEAPLDGWKVGTIADYMGIPTGVDGFSVSALPFRAYALICNEWFRDQNLERPCVIDLGESTITGSNSRGISHVQKGGYPFKVSKYHDYFTSCLPAPQRGPSVTFDLLAENFAPVRSYAEDVTTTAYTGSGAIKFGIYSEGAFSPSSGIHNVHTYNGVLGSSPNAIEEGNGNLFPMNLKADMRESLGAVSVNDLRLAFQMQKFYERSARSGARYRETLLAHFGVHSPDARMMIPEYLGGHRFPLSIHQVTNTSQSESDFLGDLGAMSNTSDVHDDYIHSFTEHGLVISVCCVRYDHSYPQACEAMWWRKNMFDFYWPELANVGEMPVYKREICLTGTSSDNQVFGYQEAWASYRYRPNRCSALMRPGVDGSLASWHLADYYESVPTLSSSWIKEDLTNVDRTLAVSSLLSNQVFADFYIKNIATMPMPVFSVPGLIDHH